MTLTAARVVAIAIAVLATIDPALTVRRAVRPIIAVIGDRGDAALAEAATNILTGRFTVVRGTSDAAAAVVVAGGVVPDERPAERVPAFALWPDSARPRIRISQVDAPSRASLDARLPVDIRLAVSGAPRRNVALQVIAGGVLRTDLDTLLRLDSGAVSLRPTLVPVAGSQVLQFVAHLAGSSSADTAYALVEARAERFPVLFFDARPTWHSTFVRRAAERDVRFSVSHRVQTSRGLANTAGRSPTSLADPRALREFAAVVVGSPETLDAAEVHGLESYMRERGGRVILLMDNRTNTAIDRLTGTSGWRILRTVEPSPLRNNQGEAVLRTREVFAPRTIQNGAEIIAFAERDSTRHAAIWSAPVGAGRVTVSGAGDAWHFREQGTGFDTFWVSTIAAAAQQSPDAIDIRLSRQVLASGEETIALVTIRDVYLADGAQRARVRASLVSESDSTPVRLWPDDLPGTFRARIVAPRRAAVYRLVVASGSDRFDAPIVVEPAASFRGTADRRLLEAWVSSRGGTVVDEPELRRLPLLIASAIAPSPRVETWHPMRSGWWIVPFAVLLGAEWFWRRRRGQQ